MFYILQNIATISGQCLNGFELENEFWWWMHDGDEDADMLLSLTPKFN